MWSPFSVVTDSLQRYTHWLHTKWPDGEVERLPEVGVDGATNVPGVRVVGDLAGIPLLKFSADTGARAVAAIFEESDFQSRRGGDVAVAMDDSVIEGGSLAEGKVIDIAIIGGGVSGMAAAFEARKRGVSYAVFESARSFATIHDFPQGKPIYTYPLDMTPAGDLQFTAEIKETLVEELEAQQHDHGVETIHANIDHIEQTRRDGATELVLHASDGHIWRALRVVVAIGRSGNYRELGVPGQDLNKVHKRLHDPRDCDGARVLVVGGGDTALEAAAALTESGADVTLSYRSKNLTRPKPENSEKVHALARDGTDQSNGSLRLMLGTTVQRISDTAADIVDTDGAVESIGNDAVFTMIGRDAPLDFFRRSGISIHGEWTARTWSALAGFVLFCTALYNWKSWGWLTEVSMRNGWWPFSMPGWMRSLGGSLGEWSHDPSTLLGTVSQQSSDPGFYYTIAYSLIVLVFGIRRIKRRRTAYVKRQTISLTAVQIVPLFLLPYILLPWMGANGWFDSGVGGWIGDQLFPDGSYWRAFGLILAWPLFVYNIFTSEPIWAWVALGFVQTFVLIPAIVYRWGKGAYCGWICSCGALAETLGDQYRYKMPHGGKWNRLNMAGQVVLAFAFVLLAIRIAGWIWPESWAATSFSAFVTGDGLPGPLQSLSYKWFVDVFLAGIVGYGVYFWLSGRVWCRFFCPLAALMHIYARFSQFRIFSEKSKCISCNVCTSACHQGIDVMSFANKGEAMIDPECVRCSACVQECPTGVLTFGRLVSQGGRELPVLDTLPASAVRQ
jgi:NosR/NirI family transcriptional regulator, nitrous oxide reductase regulator